MRRTNSSMAGDEFRSLIKLIDEGMQRVFEFFVLLRPGGVLLGFANGFFHVGVETIALNRPRANQGLVEEVLCIAIGEAVGFELRILSGPAAEEASPFTRDF